MVRKKIVALIVILSTVANVILFCTKNASACEIQKEYIDTIRQIDNSFLYNEAELDECHTSVITPWGDAVLAEFFKRNEIVAIGYAIILNELVLEFSESASPYDTMQRDESSILYYDFVEYQIITKEEAKQIVNCDKELICYRLGFRKMRYGDESAILPGVSPQLQNGTNCILTALTHVIWYLGSSYYSALISGKTFSTLRTAIDSYFSSYANNNVLMTACLYALSVSSYYFTGGANWNPVFSNVMTEIDAGYPCMVGFAASPLSPYSQTEGHMTMCYGYLYDFNNDAGFVRLADGHSTSMVTRLWTTCNDCIIVLRIHQL